MVIITSMINTDDSQTTTYQYIKIGKSITETILKINSLLEAPLEV